MTLNDNTRVTHEPVKIDPTHTPKPKLTDHYVIVPQVDLRNEERFVQRRPDNGGVKPSHDRIPSSKLRDEAWINYVGEYQLQEELEVDEVVTGWGFHSKLQQRDFCQTLCRDWYLASLS